MTYIILIVLIILMLIGLYIRDKDIFSPAFLSLLAFLGAFVFSFIGIFSWNDRVSLSPEVMYILLVGLLSFLIGAKLVKLFLGKKQGFLEEKKVYSEIKIEKWKIVLSCLFIVATIVLMFLEIKRICSYFGYNSSNLANLLSFYRSKSILYTNEISSATVEMNFFVKQMHKVSLVLGILFIYAFCNNFFSKNRNYSLILPVIFSMGESILTSGRSLLMRLILIFILCIMYFKVKKDGKIKFKTIATAAVSVVLVLLVFYIMLPLLGRNAGVDFVKYISFYFGCGIPSFDIFLENYPTHIGYIGEETFTGVYLLLNKFNVLDFTRIASYGWETIGGMHSNIYTSLKAYFFDFGILGVVILQLIFGFLTTLYYSLSKKCNKRIFMFIYFFYIYIFIEQIRAEQFYALISSTTVSQLLIILVVYYLLYKFDKVKLKGIFNKILKK